DRLSLADQIQSTTPEFRRLRCRHPNSSPRRSSPQIRCPGKRGKLPRGIVDAVNHAGSYTHPSNGQVFPKIQVMTIGDLLLGKRPNLPGTVNPYMKATRIRKTPQSEGLF